MKKLIAASACLLVVSGSWAQDHPLRINTPVEAQEFIIFHTANSSGSSIPTNATLGHYNWAPGVPVSQRIVQDHSITLGANMGTTGAKFLNALALDYNGDRYDEVILAKQEILGANQRMMLAYPDIAKNPLSTGAVMVESNSVFSWPGDREPILKMGKADFNGDGKDEFAVLFRNYSGDLFLEVRSVVSAAQGSVILGGLNVQPFLPLSNSNYEAFDLTIGDFNGDGTPDIAVAAFEAGTTFSRRCFLQLFEVNPSANTGPWTWFPSAAGKITVTETGGSIGWENLALSAGRYLDTPEGRDQIAIALAFVDPNQPQQINQRLYLAESGSGGNGLNTVSLSLSFYSDDQINIARPAVALASGDLNGDEVDEIVLGLDGAIRVFSAGPGLAPTSMSSGSAGNVQDQFYQLVRGNAYLSVQDADLDSKKDILVITTDDDGSSGNPQNYLKVRVYGTNDALNLLTVKGEKNLLSQPYSGNSSDFVYATTFGEFSGGRAILREPTMITRKIVKPLIVNNGPPHHFDIIGSLEADITECFPTWPTTAAAGSMESIYEEVTTTSKTLETTLKSDWGVSGTLSAGGSVLGIGLKASVTAKYGEEFSNTQSGSTSITISTKSTARADDQIYGVVQDYEIYEYPVDSSNVTIGYVLAMVRTGTPIIQWMDSKSTDALGFTPNHEVGNLFSYPSSANFDDYNGVLEKISFGPGYNFGSGGNALNFSMTFSDFVSSNSSTTRTFGTEVSASAGYFGAELGVEGSYSSSELVSHTSTAASEISYISDLDRALSSSFSDANYTVTPHVYWGENGAITLDYAVDPSIPGGATTNFWKDYYTTKPDLTVILPWKYEPEKGQSLGNTPDKRRLSKSIAPDKTSWVTGDTVIIRAYIHNYSLKDYNGDASFQFYAGNPDNNGQLLTDINGLDKLTVSGLFPARGRTPVYFHWKVPPGINSGATLYIVIDPDDLIDEVHEDNNVGFYGLGSGVVSVDEWPNLSPISAKLFPNPAGSWTQLELVMPASGTLQAELLDLHGRIVKPLFDDDLAPGNYILPIDLSDVPAGYHFVRMRIDGRQKTLKLIRMER